MRTGFSQFEIEETPIETADGSYEVSLSVEFRHAVEAIEELSGNSIDELGAAD